MLARSLGMLFILFSLQINAESFAPRRECILVEDLNSGKVVLQKGDGFCTERLSPESTFKIALALMAFDSGALTNKEQVLKWDGSKQPIEAWQQDANAERWLKESVVWFSQRLTPKIGLEKIEAYLKDFHYGNQDFSGGITKAWLMSTLKISAREQVDFLRRARLGELKVSEKTTDTVMSILPIEVKRPDLRICGKTGSGSSWENEKDLQNPNPYQIGWYVGYAEKGSKVYAFASVFTDKVKRGEFVYSGKEAKEMAVKAIENLK